MSIRRFGKEDLSEINITLEEIEVKFKELNIKKKKKFIQI